MKSERKPIKLIEKNIPRIKADARGKLDHFQWDEDMRGFGLRVQYNRASWVYQYSLHGKSHRITLGNQAVMSADAARSAAKEAAGRVEASRNRDEAHPAQERKQIADERRKAEEKRPGDTPFGSRIEEYLATRSGLRDSSFVEIKRYLEQHFKALHKIPLAEIRRIDVADVLNGIKAPVAHNRARSALSKFFAWAIGRGLCEFNPVVGTNKAEGEKKRERTLTDAEIAAVWINAPDNDYGRILKLLLLTGCRRDEIGGLKWNEFDREAGTITIPGERTKNKREHIVPLSDAAMEILAGTSRRAGHEHMFGRTFAGGFNGWSNAKAEFDEAVKLDDWVVHDLRRTAATQMAELGVQPHIVEACLNHISGHKGGVAGIYNRATYLPEKKKALDRWAHHIKTIVAQATGANVTALRKGEPRKLRR